jgi:ABC-type multidrug transport system fused ATPase/permease subunit
LIDKDERNPFAQLPALSMLKHGPMYYCLYTLPPELHFSIILLSMILIICAALTIQDYASGLHSYSIIHSLRPAIHWIITFLSDLILCLLWLVILILIDRFVHQSTFNSRFSALTPLFFIANLPFIYLLARLFKAPIIGATVIMFILQFAHILFTFRVIMEVFRSYRAISTVIRILRWVLLLIFPNVNVFTLIVSILRRFSCPFDDSLITNDEEFSDERYPHKVLIHTLILLGQFLLYFILLILLDTYQFPLFNRGIKRMVNKQENENDDVAEERLRISAMNEDDKQREALIVENLSKRYGWSSIPAVNRLTFAVPHRQCFGLLGFNGSGRLIFQSEVKRKNKSFY